MENCTNTIRKHKLSVVIPCFNEEKTLKDCVNKVMKIQDENLGLEIILIDDASTDNSPNIAFELQKVYPELIFIRHAQNKGKGACLRTGFKVTTGDYVVVQDADLEYNPFELKKLIEPLINDESDVVFGSRFLLGEPHKFLFFWHYLINKILTTISNLLTKISLTDIETCYKVFRSEIIKNIQFKENGFGFEAEFIAKIDSKNLRICEMGISYNARSYREGKKIGILDGLRTLYCIFRYNISSVRLLTQTLIIISATSIAALLFLLISA